jgi:hypothetical protein
MICPAYQSAFIHDPVAMSRKVSYFVNDSTPKVLTVSKNRYLIIPEASYRKKLRSLQTIAMKPIPTVIPDSLQEKKKEDRIIGAEQDSTATAPDSLKSQSAEDSVYQISIDKEVRVLKFKMDSSKFYIDNIKYTSDQDNYMWYFRDVLVLPDVRAALMNKGNKDQTGATGAEGTSAPEKKGGFFKNLFKKKTKPDSTATPAATSPSDSTATAPAPKKKFGGLFKKKSATSAPVKPVDPAKKEDDGF